MRNIFIVNPKAGKGKGIKELTKKISDTSSELGIEAEIYITKGIGDAEIFARKMAKETEGKTPLRLFSCGGDGTFNEILNGIIGFNHAEVGAIPIGTGNDYVKNFPEAGDFFDIKSQLTGKSRYSDIIKYSGICSGKEKTRYCSNMFNIGFDCNVVDLTAKLKGYPMIGGSLAYLLAVIGTLIKKKGTKLKIEVDGEVVEDGYVLLCAVANGSYCGGGIKSSPQAVIDDGYFDINVIYDVSRITFLKFFPKYKKGTHLQSLGIEKIVRPIRCRAARITPKDGTFRLCTDGEIETAGTITMEIVPAVIKFIVPSK